jgi:magnesium-transporting ATPase (P-type)
MQTPRQGDAPANVLQPSQVELAYWAAASWGGYISLSKDDADAVADLPAVMRLAEWAWNTQPEFGDGALASLMGTLEAARTAAVNMLVLGELVYLFNARHFVAHSLARDTLTDNRYALWAALALLALQALFTYAPPMQALFRTTGLDGATWALLWALALAKFFAVEAEKWLLRRCGVQRL